MLIGISGTICSGKNEVQQYLEAFYGFEPVQGEHGKVEQVLEKVTKNWRKNYVIILRDEDALNALCKRPFFLHVTVDGPVLSRFERYKNKRGPCELRRFLELCDEQLYTNGLSSLILRSSVRVINASNSLTSLHALLVSLRLTDPSRLRPTWDLYFMQLASLAAQRSNCMKRRVGCVLVQGKRVLSTGYNGTPRGLRNCNDGGCERCNLARASGLELGTCLCMHAEENALLEAGRSRIGDDTVLYCDTCPCLTCGIKIVQVGIKEVVYNASYSMDKASAKVLQEGGVSLRQYSPPPTGLVL